MNVGKIMSRRLVTLRPEATVLDAARVMRAKHVGSVIIADAAERPLGLLTDRDIVVGVIAHDDRHLGTLALSEVLVAAPILASEDETTDAVLERMRRHGVRRMPVIDERGVLVGVVALDDVLRTIAIELADVSELLDHETRREEHLRP